MSSETLVIQTGLSERPRKSRWPARLDILQSVSGLILALFMWGHMFFVASILINKDAMWTITKLFEGYVNGHYLFGDKSHPWLVSIVVAFVAVIFIVHAAMAVRKFPINYRQLQVYRAHAKSMRHGDTTLWIWQVYTGFAMFFLASAHLYQMMVFPQNIGPFGSGDRMWSDGLWPFYLVLLLAVELHGGIGLYRLAVKWDKPKLSRAFLKNFKWGLTAFFLILGLATMAAYMKIGYEHRHNYGQPYVPAWIQSQHEAERAVEHSTGFTITEEVTK
ncbi:MAG: fumarate reductase cytochrome b subunit [Burkholderiales bacterium]|jgi:fumarate reductase subunit C|nr:fumarate reductase cytochrome b subunit [Burkholderiales bacterium]